VIAVPGQIYPFNDPVGDCLVLNQRLSDTQRAALCACGCDVTFVEAWEDIDDPGPYLVLDGNLYATPEALQAFLTAARAAKSSVQASAAAGTFVQDVLWHRPKDDAGNVPLPLWFVQAGEGGAPTRRLPIELDEQTHDVRLPPHMATGEGKGMEMLITRRALVPIDTWINLYQANMQGLWAMTARARHLPWWRLLWAFALARGNLLAAMGHLNVIGKRCRIHPTAVVELCEIGDDVEIGAYAVVRMSVIGNGVNISDHASIRGVVLGEGAHIANNNNLLMTAVYPRSFLISGPYQFSMFGYDTAVMHCIDCDTRLDGKPIRAEVGEGVSVSTPLRYLGSCFGHGVRAGAGSITAPGRAIPNGIYMLPDPNQVVNRVDAGLPRKQNLFTYHGELSDTWQRWAHVPKEG
jgi:carbonic anhydrase/acetyltransferase-like protein (isoleucine patch superfamily)